VHIPNESPTRFIYSGSVFFLPFFSLFGGTKSVLAGGALAVPWHGRDLYPVGWT
jgi:hypothetical protein